MKKFVIPLTLLLALSLALTLLASCGGNQEAQEQVRIQAAVAATLARLIWMSQVMRMEVICLIFMMPPVQVRW